MASIQDILLEKHKEKVVSEESIDEGALKNKTPICDH